MKGVVIFLVLTLVLFMAEPVEPRFRSGFQNGLRKFKAQGHNDRDCPSWGSNRQPSDYKTNSQLLSHNRPKYISDSKSYCLIKAVFVSF
uniref:Serum amyloid A protein n=1 Tax=Neolamprologus brichardi TaxID=32507 RepID=A0A3Q4GWK1_NEOBR